MTSWREDTKVAIDISVVIPTYKEEKYIAKTINSLKAQSAWNRMQVVIADYDPEAKQQTVKAISAGCSEDVKTHVKVINVNKNGIGYARHMGISESAGDYIVNFDSDSFFSSPNDVDMMVKNLSNRVFNQLTEDYTDVKAVHCSVVIQPTELYNLQAVKFNMLYNLRNSLLSMSRLPACYEQGLTLSKKTYWDSGGFKDVREFEGPLLCTAIIMLYSAFSLYFEPRVTVQTSARRGMGSDGFFFDSNYSHAYR